MKYTTRNDRSELVGKQLSALYEEYRTRAREIESFSTRYHRQVGYIQTYLAALSSLGSYVYFTQPAFFSLAATKGEHSLEIYHRQLKIRFSYFDNPKIIGHQCA